MAEMVAHQLTADRTQRLLHRRELRDDVGAVAVLFNHPLQSSHLPFDAAETRQVAGLDVTVHGNRLSPGRVTVGESTATGGAQGRLGGMRSVCHEEGRYRRSRREFETTLTELNAIAALARIGLSNRRNAG